MTDDPRLEAVMRAHARFYGNAENSTVSDVEGRAFYVMIRAFLGEDAEQDSLIFSERQSEIVGTVVPKPFDATTPSGLAKATATVAAGADPPFLADAMRAALSAYWSDPGYQRFDDDEILHLTPEMMRAVRAVLRVANAQPVSENESDAALKAVRAEMAWLSELTASRIIAAALEAAAKVRAGG